MNKVRSKNEAKRQQILTAATELFTEQGFIETSMVEIANKAEVSKQTVYSHFGKKEDLFSAAIAQKCESSGFLEVNTIEFTDAYSVLLTLAKRFFSIISSKEAIAVHRVCAYEAKSYPQLSELFFAEGPDRIKAETIRIMQKLHDMKLLHIENSEFAAIQFLHMIKGEAWMRGEFNTQKQMSAQEVEDYIITSVKFFIRGYAVE